MKVLFLPAWWFFSVNSKKNPLCEEDFDVWITRHKLKHLSRRDAFFSIFRRFPEYRYILYFRLPFIWGNLLNLIYPRQKLLRISVPNMSGGCLIEHGYSSTITARSIGKNFMFHQCCTVGWNHGGCPIIGDNVKMYTGAVIAGPVRIGNNVTIGANSVVLNDVPDNMVVYGNPCLMVKK